MSSLHTMQIRKAWSKTSIVLRKTKQQPRIQYPEKSFFINEGKMKTLLGQQKSRESVASKTVLEEV